MHESGLWRIRHSNETDISGYCILESKRHFLDLSQANESEFLEYGALLAKLMAVQRNVISDCQRIYTFSLAEAVPHFHVHVIPRRSDFPSEFKGRGIMSYPLAPALDLDALTTVVELLKEGFAGLS